MWMYFGMEDCCVPFLGHCDLLALTSDHVYRIVMSRAYNVSPTLLDRNLKFGVCMHLWIAVCCIPFFVNVTLTLTSDLVFLNNRVRSISRRLFEVEITNLVYGGRNHKFGVWMHLAMAKCHVPFSGHCDIGF